MPRVKGVGWGLVYVGSLTVINSGICVRSGGDWFLTGVVLVLLGAALVRLSGSKA